MDERPAQTEFDDHGGAAVRLARLHHHFRAWREYLRGERELRLLSGLLDPARNSVDIGAHKGVYTYWMQRYSRHVYAFEPNPRMYRVLCAGVRGNVTTSPVALSDTTGRSRLRIPKTAKGFSNQGASLNYGKVGADYGEVEVETRRLDDAGIADVGFVKIDVEGHESAVLTGARGILARDRPVLLIEIEEAHTRRPIEESLAEVEAHGYETRVFVAGALRARDAFDPETNHRRAPRRADYVFNFLFFPRDG